MKKSLLITACFLILLGLFIPPLFGDYLSELVISILMIGCLSSFIFIVANLFLYTKERTQNQTQESIVSINRGKNLTSGIIWILLSIVLILNPLWLLRFFSECIETEGFTFMFACLFGWYEALGSLFMLIGLFALGKGIAEIIRYNRKRNK